MDKVKTILASLRQSPGFVSGDRIADMLNISRTAVWKYIKNLEKAGYIIDRSKGRGYRLVYSPDRLFPWEIETYADTGIIGREIIYREAVDSTNALAFKLALSGKPEGTCVIAENQNAGRGRLNRAWFSPPGKNIYLSVILRPSVNPSKVYPITFLSCLAVYDTIEKLTGITPTLKWPNDVLINGKKICGTLLEISAETDMVRFVIIGIGFNINMKTEELQDDIKDKATSLYIETKKIYERNIICGILLSNLEIYYEIFKNSSGIEICKVWERRAKIKGIQMEVNQMGEIYRGVAEGVDASGALLLNIGGKTNRILAGDAVF